MRFKKRFYLFAIFLILAVVVAYAYHFIKTNNKPIMDLPECKGCNIVLITLTNVGAEHLGVYGYQRNTSPKLDRFAQDSIVFENAFTQMSWSLPVVASLFTSEYPITHGLMNRQVLSGTETTLAEILKIYGYETAAFTGGGDYRERYGVNQGFSTFKSEQNVTVFTGSFRKSTKNAYKWLLNNKGKKFFIFVQGYDAHCPFEPPENYKSLFDDNYNGTINTSLCIRSLGYKDSNVQTPDTLDAYYFTNMTVDSSFAVLMPVNITKKDIEHLRTLYDGEVRYVDDLVGGFLEELGRLGLLNNTIIIILGDHGETFGEHGRLVRIGATRGNMYNNVIHIPLIIRHPFVKNGKKIYGLVQIIDIMPTVLDFFGIPLNREAQGKSFVPLIEGRNNSVHEYIFSGGFFGSTNKILFKHSAVNYAVTSKKWKLIYERSTDGEISSLELYDIENDPNELNNLVAEEPEIAMQLKKQMLEWEKASIRQRNLKKIELSQEELKAAREAGYTD